ncbi:transporter, Ompp1/FadL/TodX domain protein [Leptospira ryugenii]|uniref:Transporter, Ompp1/FadL/TodX domain protein n=1 Tax=Leptospira ryugenii TaxID=1917863 RepID=A0A2P2E0L6_9LEPT|nr:outer membrane protein transport protein [Leptospira ryugenii]GBF50412.1 transporter, Ompp1/FadL/TodX domain protein [Leptospira ryugenii]
MKRPILILILFLLPVILIAGSYGDVYGGFPRQSGMAGAVSSFVNNSSSPFYNIAGLARKNEQELIREKSADPTKEERQGFHELSLSYNYVDPRISTNLARRESLSETKDHHLTFGLTLNLNEIYKTNNRLRFGINLISPATGNLVTINDQNPNVPRPIQSGAANERPIILGGLAYEIWKDHLFFGIGFNAFLRGGGSILLKNVPISQNQSTPDQQVILQLKPIINPIFGLQFHWRNFDFGLSYRRETFLSVDPLATRAQTTLLGIQLDLDLALLDLYQPKVYTGGISYLHKERYRFGFDVNLEKWSEYRISRTKATYSGAPEVKDTTNLRFGFEYLWKPETSFRLGYARRPSAIGDTSGRANLLDFDRNIYTIGMSYTITDQTSSYLANLKKAIVLDLVLDYQTWTSREITKREPSPDNPNYSYGGKALHIGFGITTFL